MGDNKLRQSAAKPLSSKEYEECSQTIANASTLLSNTVETGDTLTSKVEGEDIVEIRFRKFLERSKQKYKDTFDYSFSEYINAKTKINIICTIHNFSFEQTPDKHLQSKYPCPKCNKELRAYNRKSNKDYKPTDFYKTNLENKYNLSFKYIRGKGLNSIFSFNCPVHGETEENYKKLFTRKHLCKFCGQKQRIQTKTENKEEVYKQLKDKFPHLDFILDVYKNKKSKIKVICKEHGEFEKTAQKLLVGQQCFKCRVEELIKEGVLIGGYSEELFDKNPSLKNTQGWLYLLKIDNYFKVGITRRSVKNRIKSLKYSSKCKTIEVLYTVEKPFYECFKIEQELIKELNDFRIFTPWSTELFSKDITNNFLMKI